MSLLLNWRVWAAILLCLAQAAFGWKAYKMGESSSLNALEALKSEYTSQALAAEQAARAKEQSLQVANRKVSANYETLKTATAVAVGALGRTHRRGRDRRHCRDD